MAAFRQGALFRPAWGQLVRHKSKPNIQKTRIPHPVRLRVMETTAKPLFEMPAVPTALQCENIVKNDNAVNKKPTQYERLLGEELVQLLDKHPLVGIYHSNSILARSLFNLRKLLLRNGMFLKTYNRYIVRTSLLGTRYEPLIPLFQSHSKFVFSHEPRVDLMLKLQKKMPEYILMAAVVENRILSKPQLEWYGSLPGLDFLRAQLCFTLNMAAMHTVQHLNHHQQQLWHSLKTLSEPKMSSDVEKSSLS